MKTIKLSGGIITFLAIVFLAQSCIKEVADVENTETTTEEENFEGSSNNDETENTFTYWVNSERVDCEGVGQMECLEVQKGDTIVPENWEYFYATIEGFDFEAGYVYKLRVNEEHLDPATVPADASSIRYTLVEVLEKNAVPSENTTGADSSTTDQNTSAEVDENETENIFVYWVNTERVDCEGVGQMECLEVQKGDTIVPENWEYFYATIEGFDFESGYLYKLSVKEEHLDPATLPADALSIRYTLVEVLEKI